MAMGGSQSPSAGHAVAAIVSATGRIVGWSLLGAVVGRGLAFFVPNLAPRHALMGGAVGGALAAVAFLFFTFVGDTLGRFVGAAILGASIGLMIALFEAAFREVWLEVRFGTREIVNVSVGSSPVKIGSDGRACTIYARGARPLEVGYQLREGSVGVQCRQICNQDAWTSSRSSRPACTAKNQARAPTFVISHYTGRANYQVAAASVCSAAPTAAEETAVRRHLGVARLPHSEVTV